MCKFSSDTKAKLGNTIAYIANNVQNPSKTKVLKLLYIMEEKMVSKYGIPFLGLPFEVWELGPVQKDVFVAISNESGFFDDYVTIVYEKDNCILAARKPFDEDEFSQLELTMMQEVIAEYGDKTAKQLVDYLHSKNSLWYKVASEKGLLEAFREGLCSCSDIRIDFCELLPKAKKEAYQESLLIHETANEMKASANV